MLCSIISIKLLCNCIKLQYITANVQSLIAAEYIKIMLNQGHHNICNKFYIVVLIYPISTRALFYPDDHGVYITDTCQNHKHCKLSQSNSET